MMISLSALNSGLAILPLPRTHSATRQPGWAERREDQGVGARLGPDHLASTALLAAALRRATAAATRRRCALLSAELSAEAGLSTAARHLAAALDTPQPRAHAPAHTQPAAATP